MLQRLHILYPCLILGLIWTSGCITQQERVQRRYVVTQRASLPAPVGPATSGTITAPGKVSAQGGVRVTYVTKDAQDNETLGHLMMNRTAHGRLTYGIHDRLELSVTGMYGNTHMASPTSTITPNDDGLVSAHSIWGGLHARALAFGDRHNGLAVFGGASLGRVPFNRHVETTTTRFSSGNTPTSVTTEETSENSAELHVIGQSGVQAFLTIHPLLTLNGGVMVQAYPRFWAKRVTGEACVQDGLGESCRGDTPETLEPYNHIAIGTLFVGGTIWADGPLSIHSQLFYHGLSQDVIRNTVPLGGDLQLRVTF